MKTAYDHYLASKTRQTFAQWAENWTPPPGFSFGKALSTPSRYRSIPYQGDRARAA